MSPEILIIDDETDARDALADALREAGYAPIMARNGVQALQLLRSGLRPAAMLVDLHMPLMDGQAFCSACDVDPTLAALPRIVVSGQADAKAQSRRLGARVCLTKPVDARVLVAAVQAFARPVPAAV